MLKQAKQSLLISRLTFEKARQKENHCPTFSYCFEMAISCRIMLACNYGNKFLQTITVSYKTVVD
jgi:hypothetical protein